MYLADTHVIIWWMKTPRLLSTETRKIMAHPDNLIWVSTASLSEMVIKARIGKLDLPKDPVGDIIKEGFKILDIKPQHAMNALSFPHHHRDPFDHMIIAQASFEKLTILTKDKQFKKYNVPLINA